MSFRRLLHIDYSLYLYFVLTISTCLPTVILLLFLFFGWETDKYPSGKILLLLYFFLILTAIYVILLLKRNFIINKIMNRGKYNNSKVVKKIKEKNDCIKIYLETAEQNFTCYLRRSRKNRNQLDNMFNEGDSVRIKHIVDKAIPIKYYSKHL